jgi:subtilisin family serine protease
MVLAAAIRHLARPGRVLVAAAGNHRNSADPQLPGNTTAYPAGLPEVTAVGGLGPNREPAEFSPRPQTAPWLDVARPAVGVRSTYRENGYARWSGTSFAAARFAGELAARTTGGSDPTPVAQRLARRWRARHTRQYGR